MRGRLLGMGVAAGSLALGGGLGWLAERKLLDPDRREARGPRPTPPPPHEVRTVTGQDGIALHVEVSGRVDGPTLVLVHGWGMQIASWSRQLVALGDAYRIVAYDQRGHGRSERPANDDFSVEAMGADLWAVLGACVPPGQRCVVVGHSMGGMAALAAALADPAGLRARLAGTALVSTAANEILRRTAASGGSAVMAALEQVTLPRLTRRGLLDLANDLSFLTTRTVVLTPDADPGVVADVQRLAMDCDARTRSACIRVLARLDVSAAIPLVPGPVLVVVGERDRITPPRQSAVLAAGRTDAELVLLPGVGHMAPMEAPEAFTARLRDFADRALAPEARGDRAPASRTAAG